MGERGILKGDTSCEIQGTPLVCHDWKTLSGNVWSSEQNNNNNAWNTAFPGGGTNNNNKNNWYFAVPFAEFDETLGKCLEAEEDCYKNKKSKMDASRFHFHLAEIVPLTKAVNDGTYRSDRSICFVVTYPTIREVFCAQYKDRIIHHLVAPYLLAVAEAVHNANGDVSHGNRKGHSAHTAALQIQEKMKTNPDGYVFKFDVKSFFMSIDREKTLELFLKYEGKYRPQGYSEKERTFLLSIIKILVLSDPTEKCELRSKKELHDSVPFGKSLFTCGGTGFPIGNFYSQILANLVLAVVDSIIRTPHFVDDYSGVKSTIEEVQSARADFINTLSNIGLKAHSDKVYIQPVRHGVPFCGKFIYTDRIYISNRVVKACFRKIDSYCTENLETAQKIMQSVNSYTGMMKHCRSFNIQKRIMEKVLQRFGKWLCFKNKHGHLVCQLKNQYKQKNKSIKQIEELDSYFKNIEKHQKPSIYN